jgi:hypothetical protein
MDIIATVPLTVRITGEARQCLERAACRIVYDERDRLPLGRLVTAMVLWFEDNNGWQALQKEIRADLAREQHERRKRDRERKRRRH